jgi:hypothetical protein
MKFVLKNPNQDGGCKIKKGKEKDEEEGEEVAEAGRYLQNLHSANATVSWRDVVRVRHDMVNSKGIQCPICMETLETMVCPRITKCGHVYCWPCMLQYLDFEHERSWKRCPLCFDPVYPLDLKPVQIHQTKQFTPGDQITFNLMVRIRTSTLVKDKHIEHLQV